ncbi:MAG: hypothetical protein ABW082_03750 [Sedimenticola sp.]
MDNPTDKRDRPHYLISQEIIDDADRCLHENACLYDCRHDLCQLGSDDEGVSRILVCNEKSGCAYSSDLGKHRVCSCPVRHALHKKYGL